MWQARDSRLIVTNKKRKMNTKIFGTLGPSCRERTLLKNLIQKGMNGVRLNLSHKSLSDSEDWLTEWQEASKGTCDLLVDMQGPEMRIGSFEGRKTFEKGDIIDIPIQENVLPFLTEGQEVLLDDGKILARVLSLHKSKEIPFLMLRSGELSAGKSIKIPNVENTLPPLTQWDYDNIARAKQYGVTGVMQPFVRGSGDLIALRKALSDVGADDIQIFAKIENRRGIEKLDEILNEADWIVIARGDLGNDMNLWELPTMQRKIAKSCKERNVPFIVVTQMLQSMEHSPVPTRAEISDIDHAIVDGASGVMVTGETAVGDYPLEVIHYLVHTVKMAEQSLLSFTA